MTTNPAEPLRAEDDPHLDWHSDARRIMDSYANDVCYRQIAGTQIALMRLAASVATQRIEVAEVVAAFEMHIERCAAAGTPERSFTRESFTGFLTARELLHAAGDGGFELTSVGRGFLHFLEDGALPDKDL